MGAYLRHTVSSFFSRQTVQTCSVENAFAVTCKQAWLAQEVEVPEVPPATPKDLVLLVCQSSLRIFPLRCSAQSSAVMMGVCTQQHWRSLTRAFQTSCYRIDPKAEKRERLSSRTSRTPGS